MKTIKKIYTDREYQSAEHLEIEVDGETLASFNCQRDCPEDNNLSRNFKDCYKIDSLMQMAFEAGKKGESFEVEHQEGDYKDL